ncbi:copper homeostasis protein CutC [Phytomonospora endophytica]|uniref:Copper homeostasis protein cutC homolog n=1 Tax=Phytomonospora endophytica TaxID=714109 RepID=A0A841G2C6_9ACTN|nr:copper homeostasis protein CutC [Phytomonospora endophytica]MBB6039797.1 copper homeostasis protein [Phytomonospora endophytica]GIG70348.1 copper homeostasis protein CutC [Phytomonospora endophytica]
MLLEVIALDAVDAAAAADGGADRLEVVADIAADGLTPAPETVTAIKAACDLPLRVMLRSNDGFGATPAELDALRRSATALDTVMGEHDGFVYGFLDTDGAVDHAAVTALRDAVPHRAWTFHRAIDHAADYAAAWTAVAALDGVDQVLTAGSAAGVSAGRDALAAHARPELAMIGGGLRPDHVAGLVELGVRAFHIGGMSRHGWNSPVDAALVRNWRVALDGGVRV